MIRESMRLNKHVSTFHATALLLERLSFAIQVSHAADRVKKTIEEQ
jgi:hypothetical protein